MRFLAIIIFLVSPPAVFAQVNLQKFSSAIETLQRDPQFVHASLGICVINKSTGKTWYEKNADAGMAPASCQKLVTSATAFDLMGKTFQYHTLVGYSGSIINEILQGSLIIKGSGDPSFASWRWPQTKKEMVLKSIRQTLMKAGIKKITGNVFIDDLAFGIQPLPDGWIWQDIGNYYGAGAWGFNWNENQYDLRLKPGVKEGEETSVLETSPVSLENVIKNYISTGPTGSGDNGYIYAPPYAQYIFTTGTIPPGAKSFTISGSMPNPPLLFAGYLAKYLAANGIEITGNSGAATTALLEHKPVPKLTGILDSITSPSLDSLNYWFLKKSVNLYGEAFVKTIGLLSGRTGTTDVGIDRIRKFWSEKGIEKSALKIYDGSGLSPANRLTARALVSILQYASMQNWFTSFYEDLPLMNGLHLKDGYINGVRSYTGYVTSRSGESFSFSFIVNNFDGNPGTVREKMWKILDLLK